MPRMCPRCQIELKEKQNKGVTLDACDKCHGLWFDANEIDQVAEKQGLTEWLRGAARACPQPVCPWCQHPQTRHGAACEKCGGAVGAICPVCQVWMPAFEVKGVTVDFCVRCAGLWLDASELEQLMAAGLSVPSVPAAATAPTALATPGSQPAIPPAATAPTALAPGGAQPATARRPRYHAPVDAATGQPTATPPTQLPPTVSVPPPQAPAQRPRAPQPPPQGYQPPPQGYQPPPQGYQPPPQGYQPPPQGYQPPPQGYQQGYQQPQYQQPPAGFQPAPGYQQAPQYVQTPIQMVQPQPYVATPIVSAPAYYDPYWAAYPGYYAYGPGYWYDGCYYDPYYGAAGAMAVGAAVGVGAVATACMMDSVFDIGFGFW
ncbi:MAG: zf-TFIIB domain-containing protein [Deltaproteobacteria bacterium]|nr:zf-TFIIB domain-containing protein [Deltaproteobacteria bacterium]